MPTGSGPARKTYKITPRGRRECADRIRQWREHVDAINAIITGKAIGHA
jgi:DNA-binding PadR family transcriptional regulator